LLLRRWFVEWCVEVKPQKKPDVCLTSGYAWIKKFKARRHKRIGYAGSSECKFTKLPCDIELSFLPCRLEIIELISTCLLSVYLMNELFCSKVKTPSCLSGSR